MRMKNDFHIKGSAPSLVLNYERPGGTRKWPISVCWICYSLVPSQIFFNVFNLTCNIFSILFFYFVLNFLGIFFLGAGSFNFNKFLYVAKCNAIL